MASTATPDYPPITPELRDAILAAFAGFTPAGDAQ